MPAPSVSSGNYREAVERVLASEEFLAAPGLSRLFAYLAQKTLAGEAEALKEFTVGVEALGRPASYDPQADPSVRVQVSRLRKKLDAYYEGPGAGDPVHIRLPKRRFALDFEDRRSGETLSAALPAPARRDSARWRAAAIGLALGLAALSPFAWRGARSAEAGTLARPDAAIAAFWRPYEANGLPTALSLGVPLFLRAPGNPSIYVRQSLYNDWPLEDEPLGLDALRRAAGGAQPVRPSYNYAPVGGAIAAYNLGRSLWSLGIEAEIVRSSLFPWGEAKSRNVIFVGPSKFNRLVETGGFEDAFLTVPRGVRNVRPRPGEPEFFANEERDGRPLNVYAVVGRFRHREGPGVVTVLSSSDDIGVWGAVEFLDDPRAMGELAARLTGADRQWPESFEVVVRVRCDLDFPVEAEYVAHRVGGRPNG